MTNKKVFICLLDLVKGERGNKIFSFVFIFFKESKRFSPIYDFTLAIGSFKPLRIIREMQEKKDLDTRKVTCLFRRIGKSSSESSKHVLNTKY